MHCYNIITGMQFRLKNYTKISCWNFKNMYDKCTDHDVKNLPRTVQRSQQYYIQWHEADWWHRNMVVCSIWFLASQHSEIHFHLAVPLFIHDQSEESHNSNVDVWIALTTSTLLLAAKVKLRIRASKSVRRSGLRTLQSQRIAEAFSIQL